MIRKSNETKREVRNHFLIKIKFSIHSTLTNTRYQGISRNQRKLFKEMLKTMNKTVTFYLQYALNSLK